MSYTTGVPPVVGAMMMFKGAWTGKGVFNVEQLPSEAVHGRDRQAGPALALKDITPATRPSCSRSRPDIDLTFS